MPPKKAPAKKDQDEDLTEKLFKAYKKHLAISGISMPKKIAEKFNSLREEKQSADLTELAIWEPIGPEGLRAFSNALVESQYDKLASLFFWDAFIQDDGVRSLCQYLANSPSIRTLELINCRITALGCEFLGTILTQVAHNFILSFKLDYNDIGESGMEYLASGLRMNSKLMYLSLAFCNIGPGAGRAIMEILINQSCLIKDLNLQGNELRSRGVAAILRGMAINDSVITLDLTDNKCSDDQDLLDAFKDMLMGNTKLKSLDLNHNNLNDMSGQYILNLYVEAEGSDYSGFALSSLKLPEKIQAEILEQLAKAIGGKKKKGKKKGGGKKGKKKKK